MTKQRQFDLKNVLRRHGYELAWAAVLTVTALLALVASGFGII